MIGSEPTINEPTYINIYGQFVEFNNPISGELYLKPLFNKRETYQEEFVADNFAFIGNEFAHFEFLEQTTAIVDTYHTIVYSDGIKLYGFNNDEYAADDAPAPAIVVIRDDNIIKNNSNIKVVILSPETVYQDFNNQSGKELVLPTSMHNACDGSFLIFKNRRVMPDNKYTILSDKLSFNQALISSDIIEIYYT